MLRELVEVKLMLIFFFLSVDHIKNNRYSFLFSYAAMDKTRVLLQLVFFVSRTHCLLATTCPQHLRQSPRPGYHLTKECAYASTMRTVASSNATALDSCVQLAMAKNAFAFSYANQTGGISYAFIL